MEKLLITAASQIEAEAVGQYLESRGLAVLMKSSGADSYMNIIGYPSYEVEIYVDEDDYELAQNHLSQFTNVKNEITFANQPDGVSRSAKRIEFAKLMIRIAVLFVLGIPLLIVLMVIFISSMVGQ